MNTNPEAFVMADDNVGVTNRVEQDRIDTILADTFKDIASVLADHCGPYGRFAMLTRAGIQVAEPVFTKDGIGIVRAMQYASPLQEFIRNTMAYMGSRVETAAGDGTTSSMILLAKGIVKLRQKLSRLKYRYTFAELQNTYQSFTYRMARYLRYLTIKIPDTVAEDAHYTLSDVIRNAAYSQAWTSSHGNTLLAEALSALFAETPREAWNYLAVEKSRIENDHPYQVEIDQSQYSIQNITIWPESAKTEDLGLSRVREHARTIISSVAPGHDTVEGEQLLQMIDQALEQKEQLTVICYRGIDSSTQAALTDKFRLHPDHDVCLFLINDDDPRLNDLTCMKALANEMVVLLEKQLSYRYEKGDLAITDGLYELDPEAKLNPYLGKDTHKPLNDLVAHLDKVIRQVQSEVSNRKLNDEIRRLKKFRLKLTVCRRTYFKIGGSAYDNAAAVDVVLDAILATKHSLEHGFFYGGNRGLYAGLMNYTDHLKKIGSLECLKKDTALEQALVDTFRESIYEMHQEMLERFYGSKVKQIPADYFTTSVDITELNPEEKLNHYLAHRSTPAGGIHTKYETFRAYTPLVVQPLDADTEFLKRFGELALRFIYTGRIIIDGGMCRSETKN